MASFTWPAGIQIGDARIAPGEPITSDLMTDYRDRDDYLQGLFDNATGHAHTAAAGDGPNISGASLVAASIPAGKYGPGSIAQEDMGANSVGDPQLKIPAMIEAIQGGVGNGTYSSAFLIGASSTMFYPQLKMDDVGSTTNYHARILAPDTFPAGGMANGYNVFVWTQFDITAPAAPRNMYAGFAYVQASRDEPMMWMLRRKDTGEIKAALFHPDGTLLDSHPFPGMWNVPDPSYEIIAIELNNNNELKNHLLVNYQERRVLEQLMIGLWTSEIVLKDKDEFGEPASVEPILTAIEAPGLHHRDVRVLDFSFHQV